MSLHRILNADVQGSPSAPALNGAHMDSPQPVIDPALAEISRPRSNNSPNDQPTRRRSSRHSQSQQRESTVESPPAAASQPLSHIQFMQGPGYPNPNAHPDPASPWEKYDTGEWAPPPPAGASNINPPYASNGNSNGHIAAGAVIPAPDGDDSDDTPEGNGRGRKRKANDDDDADYHPRSGRRNGPRRYPTRTRNSRTSVDDGEGDFDDSVMDDGTGMTEEEMRLTSSDLDDCPEIWMSEISDYILETRKRHREVEAFYKLTVIERDSNAAYALAHRYNQILRRMPPPAPVLPPTPPPVVGYDSRTHSPLPEEFAMLADPFDNLGGAEDVAQEFEDSVMGPSPRQLMGSDALYSSRKRAMSDASSEAEALSNIAKKGKEPANKKRKTGESADAVQSIRTASTKGKGKAKQVRETSLDSVSVANGAGSTKPARKRPARKKQDALPPQTQEVLGIGSSTSVTGDMTPSPSRPPSPSLTVASDKMGATLYELDEHIPPLRKAKKVDDTTMLKRIRTLEESQKKVWTTIARRDIPRAYKFEVAGYQSRQAQLKRIATLSSIQARKPFTKTTKFTKDVQVKGKRLMREMLVFWKKNEKEERDVRKREQKQASDRAKVEEEKREAARQARKLEFLISQTELYSHFVGNKLKTAEIEGEPENPSEVPAGANLTDVDPNTLQDINFDDEDQTNLHLHARRNAQEAIAMAQQRAQEFDNQASLDRKTNEAMKLAKGQAHLRDESESGTPGPSGTPLVDLDSDELNFQNPTSLSGQLNVKQPQMLMAQLKEYQLKGLNWLATLYEQGINGILADEMGLGKTIQSISLLAHLAEKHDIWGPFLVVAPASTLHNWQQEITRFVPTLKALPYWGNPKDRATLRKFWSKKEISYDKDAPFHVVITSYQLVTQDQQYFQRVKWQYMILDEAQNIKNAASVRWKTLLGFQCRNRLLLTGTPIQNSMQELWALLHFIMPSLFDSHDEFNEWFSKDIENAAENKGSRLNEYQLRRLHMILKPFMLRRVKRHVQNELSEKIELDVYVDLSARQRALYKVLTANVSVADLLSKAANIGDAESARSLMNLVMQFRKVCNHPELFERADVRAPFSFSRFGQVGTPGRELEPLELRYSTKNPIEFCIPELIYQDGGMLDVPRENSHLRTDSECLTKLMNIWSIDWVQQSLREEHSSFSFLRFLDMTPSEAHQIHVSPLLRRRLLAVAEETRLSADEPYSLDENFAAHSATNPRRITGRPSLRQLDVVPGLPEMGEISKSAWTESCLSRPGFKWFIPPAVAPVISMYCRSRTFLEHQAHMLEGPMESLALYGLPPQLRDSPAAYDSYQSRLPNLPACGLLGESGLDQLPLSTMQVPEAKRLIYDSGKLARLDALLQELKGGDHRVLVYFQMTRMMDLMEEYLIYRQYKYLRLDGSSKLEDRRDMVMEWQTRPDIFIFLLSTRAGGLGINLTAADTVVFYDHDWNPSNDAQAMDRAHRLGQTRQVTVYRLITRGTIDERIVQLARVKKDVQDIVVGNKTFTDVTKPSEIMQLLLNADQLANLEQPNAVPQSLSGEPITTGNNDSMRELWNDEGDDFFGNAPVNNGSAAASDVMDEELGTAAAGKKKAKSSKAKAKPAGAPAAKGGRKPKPKVVAAATA